MTDELCRNEEMSVRWRANEDIPTLKTTGAKQLEEARSRWRGKAFLFKITSIHILHPLHIPRIVDKPKIPL